MKQELIQAAAVIAASQLDRKAGSSDSDTISKEFQKAYWALVDAEKQIAQEPRAPKAGVHT